MKQGFVCWACAQDAVPEKREAERAVIEAAKAWLVLVKNPDAGAYDGDLELEQAVEALQAAKEKA
jgi:hypothetical protein